MVRFVAVLLVTLLSPALARGQDTIPAPHHRAEHGETETSSVAEEEYPARPWSMPPVVSRWKKRAELREEELIGDYAQPRWTARRRFPTTRIYVVPPGKIEFEWWFRYTSPFEGGRARRRIESRYEFEMGLGHRLQLDLYLVTRQNGTNGGPFALHQEKVELRYALADWGEIWANPTLYVEWAHTHDGPDKLEGKLLLGGELASGIHAGLNVVFETELAGEEEHEYALDAGLSYTVVDEVFSIGVEGLLELVDVAGNRGDFAQQYLIGPSISYSPIPPMHLLVTSLFGVENEDGEVEARFDGRIIAGWTF
jgi:hypothetical protein